MVSVNVGQAPIVEMPITLSCCLPMAPWKWVVRYGHIKRMPDTTSANGVELVPRITANVMSGNMGVM